MGWETNGGTAKFDHAQTGWALQGKHGKVDCARCHTTTNKQGLRTYINTSSTCGGCHEKDQPHGKLRQFLLRVVLGEMSLIITEGRFSQPKRLIESGYRFQFERVEDAFADLFG